MAALVPFALMLPFVPNGAIRAEVDSALTSENMEESGTSGAGGVTTVNGINVANGNNGAIFAF